MLPNDHATDEPFDLSDTDRKVGEIVRRIKEEYEMQLAKEEDMFRRVLREERMSVLKLARDAIAFFFSQLK